MILAPISLSMDTELYHEPMAKAMEQTVRRKISLYLKRAFLILAPLALIGGGFLYWKGPVIVKHRAEVFLKENLAALGVEKVDIESVGFGWGRLYLRDIRTQTAPSAPSINVQEIDIAYSLLLKIKAMDVVGAMVEMKEGDVLSGVGDQWASKIAQFRRTLAGMKGVKLPTLAIHDGLVVIPTSQGPLKLPVHAVTETTVARSQILTLDWGESAEGKFFGQCVLESDSEGLTLDIHMANVDIQMPRFQVQAPEISLWVSSATGESEGYKLDGFAQLNQVGLDYGQLKTPLEINIEGVGTPDQMVLDEMTVMAQGNGNPLLKVEGTVQHDLSFAKLAVDLQIPQLSQVWDFTSWLAAYRKDKVTIAAQVMASGNMGWEKGALSTSGLMVDVKEAVFAQEGVSIEGGATKLTFQSLKPLITKGPQQIKAAKVSMPGIHLQNVALDMLFDEKGLWQIDQLTAETLSGTLKTHRFQRMANVPHPAFQFEADFKNIELADILAMTDLARLSGQAKLDGNALVRYDWKDGFDVLQAELHSVSQEGLLQYKPGKGGAVSSEVKEVNMAFEVLGDLHFSLLNIRITPTSDQSSEMQGIVKILGSNPKVLNGYPFEFNIVTTGQLKDLVVNTLKYMKPSLDMKELKKAAKAYKTKRKKKIGS